MAWPKMFDYFKGSWHLTFIPITLLFLSDVEAAVHPGQWASSTPKYFIIFLINYIY